MLDSFSGRKGGLDNHPSNIPYFLSHPVSEDIMKKFHYTYKLTALNPIDERIYYIGVRSSECLPEEDTVYLSSSNHVKEAQSSGVEFEKEILAVWPTRKKAVAHEIELHNNFDVGRNKAYFNRSKQKSTGFDITGVLRPDMIGGESHNQYGTKHKEESKKAIKESMKKAIAADGSWLERACAASKTPEAKAKRAATLSANRKAGKYALIDKAASDRTRRNNPAKTPEARAKMSAKSKVWCSTPEAKAKKSADMSGDKNPACRPEVKQKLTISRTINNSVKMLFTTLSNYQGNKRKVKVDQAYQWLFDNGHLCPVGV